MARPASPGPSGVDWGPSWLALERFVRIVLGSDAEEKDTLYNMLQKSVSRGLLRVPWDDQQDGITRLARVRNTLLHGSYEQAAKEAGRASVRNAAAPNSVSSGRRL